MTALDWFAIIIWSLVGVVNMVSCISKDTCSWVTFWLTYVMMVLFVCAYYFTT
jgi:hypothetical protein